MAGFDDRASVEPQSARLDPVGWLLWPLHRLVWADPYRRARKLIAFGAVEAGGGRDLVRAAELTPDPLLRRQYLRHASDEARHAAMFHGRGQALS